MATGNAKVIFFAGSKWHQLPGLHLPLNRAPYIWGNATNLCRELDTRPPVGWKIVLRIEDLDGPRIKKGAAQGLIEDLKWLGIDWDDGPIISPRG